MSDFGNRRSWSVPWFGIWRESGKGYEAFPSIRDFVDPSLDLSVRQKIVAYLKGGARLERGWGDYCMFEGQLCVHLKRPWFEIERLSTDETWIWYPDLAHYVEYHDVVLPDAFMDYIAAGGYQLPETIDPSRAPGCRPSHPGVRDDGKIVNFCIDGNFPSPTVLCPERVTVHFAECRARALSAYAADDMMTAYYYFFPIREQVNAEEQVIARKAIDAAFQSILSRMYGSGGDPPATGSPTKSEGGDSGNA